MTLWSKLFIKCALVLLLILLFPSGYAEIVIEEEYPYCEIPYTQPTGRGTRSYSFTYSDRMLLADDTSLSPDMAKASVALATAAYNHNSIHRVLMDMEFDEIAGSGTYAEDRTYWDNDRVAYTIARKQVGEYTVYCIPVRGTGGNAEWFSDFRLGQDNGGVHAGFHIAAQQVYDDLRACFIAGEKRIIWITGHSRGAAVSNMIGGWLLEDGYVQPEHLFSYNYACPAISKNPQDCGGIYNFNNAGDLITLMPLAAWGYGRNGETITRNLREKDNVMAQFARIYGETFHSPGDGQNYINVLLALAQTEEDFHQPVIRLGLTLLAYGLEDAKDTSIADILNDFKWELPGMIDQLHDVLDSVSNPGPMEVFNLVKSVSDLDLELASFIDSNKNDVAAMDAAQFAEFMQQNSVMIQKIENKAHLTLSTPDDFVASATHVNGFITGATTLMDVLRLYLDTESANPVSWVWHGHTPETYIAWINSDYYGYCGWYGSASASPVITASKAGTTVGENCFCNCSSMPGIEVQEGVRYIGGYAFNNCHSAVALILPDSLEKAGTGAFSGCSGLLSVTMPVDLQQEDSWIFSGCSNVQTIHYLKGKTGIMSDRSISTREAGGAFRFLEGVSQNALQSVDFAEGIVAIGNYAYYNYDAKNNSYGVKNEVLTTVSLPSTLKTIGRCAFYNHPGLTEITFPEGIVDLGEGSFDNARLTSVAIPQSVTEIPSGCFQNNTALAEVFFPESLKRIGSGAFAYCSLLEAIEIPEQIDIVEAYAFNCCTGLREVTMPVDLQQEDSWIFSGCSNVQTIHYLKGKTGVMSDRSISTREAGGAFRFLEGVSQNALQSVDFAEGIVAIGNYAYYNYDAKNNNYGVKNEVLTTVSLPSTLKTIGRCAFYNHPGLTEITFPEGIVDLGEGSFYNARLTSVAIPQSVTEIPSGCFQNNTALAEVFFPESLKKIGSGAFEYCSLLEVIEIPEQIDVVEAYAFYYCTGLREVTMPVDLQQEDSWIFSGCSNVQTIHYLKGKTGIMSDRSISTREAGGAFRFLEGVSQNALQSVDFAEGVVAIGNYAYYNYDARNNSYGVKNEVLTTVSLPSTLETIGECAFDNHPGLECIEFRGNPPTVGSRAFASAHAVAIYPLEKDAWTKEIMQNICKDFAWKARVKNVLWLPEMLTEIEDYAFQSCGATAVILGDRVNAIGEKAFADCSQLRVICIPAGVTDIAENAFEHSAVAIKAPEGSTAR